MGEEEWAPASRAACWGTGWVLAFLVSLFSGAISFVFSFVFLTGGWGPYYDRQGQSGAMEKVTHKQLPPTASAAAEPLPWPFGLHVAGYQIQDYTHTSSSTTTNPLNSLQN